MKTPEEWAKLFWYGEITDLDMIEQVQKEAYNQALDDVCERYHNKLDTDDIVEIQMIKK